MSSRQNKATSTSFYNLCGEIGEDDLVDPRIYFDRRKASSGKGRKSKQLCLQVERTLRATLPVQECSVLETLHVESVQPAGGTAQLLVLIACEESAAEIGDAEILDQLTRHQGRLRSEIAASITRKRTPNLIFRVLPRGDSSETEAAYSS